MVHKLIYVSDWLLQFNLVPWQPFAACSTLSWHMVIRVVSGYSIHCTQLIIAVMYVIVYVYVSCLWLNQCLFSRFNLNPFLVLKSYLSFYRPPQRRVVIEKSKSKSPVCLAFTCLTLLAFILVAALAFFLVIYITGESRGQWCQRSLMSVVMHWCQWSCIDVSGHWCQWSLMSVVIDVKGPQYQRSLVSMSLMSKPRFLM